MSETAYCDLPREDSEPRWNWREDTFDPPPGVWSPECGHAVCIAEDALHVETDNRECTSPTGSGWDCPLGECRWNTVHAACDLPAGHDGQHQYAPMPEPTPAAPAPAPGGLEVR